MRALINYLWDPGGGGFGRGSARDARATLIHPAALKIEFGSGCKTGFYPDGRSAECHPP